MNVLIVNLMVEVTPLNQDTSREWINLLDIEQVIQTRDRFIVLTKRGNVFTPTNPGDFLPGVEADNES